MAQRLRYDTRHSCCDMATSHSVLSQRCSSLLNRAFSHTRAQLISSTSELSSAFPPRSCALVSASPALLTQHRGAAIDSFDDVVRLGSTATNGNELHLGNRTSARYLSAECISAAETTAVTALMEAEPRTQFSFVARATILNRQLFRRMKDPPPSAPTRGPLSLSLSLPRLRPPPAHLRPPPASDASPAPRTCPSPPCPPPPSTCFRCFTNAAVVQSLFCIQRLETRLLIHCRPFHSRSLSCTTSSPIQAATYYLPSTAFHLLRATHYLLPTTYHWLLATCHLLLTTHCSLLATYYLGCSSVSLFGVTDPSDPSQATPHGPLQHDIKYEEHANAFLSGWCDEWDANPCGHSPANLSRPHSLCHVTLNAQACTPEPSPQSMPR